MITSTTYCIGVGNGMYPSGTKIVDKLLTVGKVSTIVLGSQAYNVNFSQEMSTGTLDCSDLITFADGNKVTVIFETPIKLELA